MPRTMTVTYLLLVVPVGLGPDTWLQHRIPMRPSPRGVLAKYPQPENRGGFHVEHVEYEPCVVVEGGGYSTVASPADELESHEAVLARADEFWDLHEEDPYMWRLTIVRMVREEEKADD